MLTELETADKPDPELLGILTRTLDQMALGGIHDHVGGGFHRYATDRIWFLPHFEKMLYDNAQLGPVYARAYKLTDIEAYAEVARGLYDFVLRDMLDRKGGFYSAYDADSEGEEGKFYLWTPREVENVLGEEAAAELCGVYQITATGNYYEEATRKRTGQSIPHLKDFIDDADLQARCRAGLAKLREARSKRVWPQLDDKVLCSWNGLMIGALAIGGELLEEPRYIKAAEQAADFVLTAMKKDGRLLRTWRDGEARLNAYLDDYAFLASGLLDLHEATGADRWLQEAMALAEAIDENFSDKNGGYFFTSGDHEVLLTRNKDPLDSAIPSGNGMTTQLHMRLGKLTDDRKWIQKGMSTLNTFAVMFPNSPRGMASMLIAVSKLDEKTLKEFAVIDKDKTENGAEEKPDARSAVVPATVKAWLDRKTIAAGDKIGLRVTIALQDKWHIYAPGDNENTIPTELRLEGDPEKANFTLEEIKYPKAEEVQDEISGGKVAVYHGKIEIKATVKAKAGVKAGEQKLPLVLTLQACDEVKKVCLIPEDHDLSIPVIIR